jgi:ABC-type dipeptide/oligopeptide/nickel transport system ATPase component
MLRVEGVSKTFPPSPGLQRMLIRTASDHAVDALRAVDLRVARGEIVGLVGPNGARKTTLLRIIATLLDPTAGHVFVDGFDTVRDAAAVRERIGLVLARSRASPPSPDATCAASGPAAPRRRCSRVVLRLVGAEDGVEGVGEALRSGELVDGAAEEHHDAVAHRLDLVETVARQQHADPVAPTGSASC